MIKKILKLLTIPIAVALVQIVVPIETIVWVITGKKIHAYYPYFEWLDED